MIKINELKSTIFKINKELTFNYVEIKSTSGTTSEFSNLVKFRNSINHLENIELFQEEINKIKATGIFSSLQDIVKINVSEGREVKKLLEIVSKLVTALNQSLDKIVLPTRNNSISVKLPIVNDLDDLSNVIANFHTILSQSILNDEINGQIKINSVENGSIWIDIFLGSTSALTLVSGLAWSAAVVYKKIQEGRILQEHVTSLKIKNESIKEIQIAQKKALDLMIDAEAKQLYTDNFKNENNNEQIERLKHSIKLLSEQIEKGAEIHPALNTPENVANLFPNFKNLELIESKIKKLNA